MAKKLLLFTMTLIISLNTLFFLSVAAAPTSFTATLKDEYYKFIQWAHREDWVDYNRFAIHDFDGDNVPEILFGKANPQNNNFVEYDVVKYSNGDFKKNGSISSSRYLIKDKYSYALLGIYGQTSGYSGLTTELSIFYIHNATIQKNSVLKSNGYNYFKSDISITQDEFTNELFNYLGTYDELMVHDSFNQGVILSAIHSWKPITLAAPYAPKLKSNIALNTTWQVAFNNFINKAIGPANTYVEPYSLTPPSGARRDYTRFALHDLTGNGVPELFLGVNHGTQVSFDVYRYVNGDVKFIGSFDAYSKYLGKFSQSNNVFSYNPIDNMFNYQTVNKIYYADNGMHKETIMQVFKSPKTGKDVYEVGNRSVSVPTFNSSLINYINSTKEIKTFDIELVPASAALVSWRPMK